LRIGTRLGLVATAYALLLPSLCIAQWVPGAGQGTVSVAYQYTRISDHLFSQSVNGFTDPATGYVGGPGNRWYMGDIFGQTVNVSADYGVWRGFAVSAGVAYVSSKYSGRFIEGPMDDGKYHGSVQDGMLNVEYMIPWQEFAITPSVGTRVPITNYNTLGHVSVGKHLREFPLGISVGRSLDPFLPRAYLAGSFEYSFVQHHHEHNIDQRHYELDAGYILRKSISVGGTLQYVNTVGGIDWFSDDLSGAEMWGDHDAAAKARYLRAGGSVSFSLGRGVGLGISYLGTLSGANTHAGQSVTLTPTWSFSAPRAR
jgi:hypothetical protein